MTETHQTHSSRTVDCPSFTEIPQHHANFGILIATKFLLKNDFSLSFDANKSFCSEAVCTFSHSQKRKRFPQKVRIKLLMLLI